MCKCTSLSLSLGICLLVCGRNGSSIPISISLRDFVSMPVAWLRPQTRRAAVFRSRFVPYIQNDCAVCLLLPFLFLHLLSLYVIFPLVFKSTFFIIYLRAFASVFTILLFVCVRLCFPDCYAFVYASRFTI